MEMYDILETAILTGGYDLSAMVKKIDTLFAADRLTEEEWQNLRKLCLEHLTPEDARPEVQAMLESLAQRVTSLEGRVDALEGKTPDPDAYPEWQPWDGMSSDYQYGAIVAHNGKLWVSRHAGQNTWEPGSDVSNQMGLWVEYTPGEASASE